MRGRKNEAKDLNMAILDWLLPFVALILPLILWSFQFLVGWSVLVEEISKLILVIWLLQRRSRALQAVVLGVLFGLSEAAMYLVNLSMLGSLSPLFPRLFLTVPMHGLTMWLMYYSSRFGVFGYVGGFVLAVLVHKMFNLL